MPGKKASNLIMPSCHCLAFLRPPPEPLTPTHLLLLAPDAQHTIHKRQTNRQIKVFAGTEEIFRRDYSRPGIQVETISLDAPRRALLRVEMTIRPQRLVFEDHVFVAYNTRFHATLKWMIVTPMVVAALPFLWGGRGSGGSLAGLPG